MDSVWTQSCVIEKREPLKENCRAEAAVIGAGLTGLLTACLLRKAGARAVVLEAGRIAGGQTGHTTAKITSQHGLLYHRLVRELGEEDAALYAEANQKAIEAYRDMVKKQSISCDFTDTCSFVYAGRRDKLEAEVQAARRLGLPASFAADVPFPAPAAGAVRFENQAQFHPLRFVKALAEGLAIYEDTPVRRVEGHRIRTDRGEVEAQHIIFACHFPFVNFPGLYFARMHQERSYVLALRDAPPIEGMWIGADPPAYSLRRWGDLLLLGGGAHRAGENTGGGRYDELRQKAREWFPGAKEAARWSAQDCVTPDGIPYIGRYAGGKPYWYVATGFGKWGMSTAMTAAMLLRDAVCGRKNPYARIFSPDRFPARGLPKIMAEGGQAVKGLARQVLQTPDRTADRLPAGQGGVVLLNGRKAGVFKSEDGKIYAVDIRCPHLGCQLEWNPDEKSWDCPCHGSRFDYQGRWLNGPAQKDIRL